MKNYISIILTAAMTLTLAACTAAPDPAPLATPHAVPGPGTDANRCADPRHHRFLHPRHLQRYAGHGHGLL